MEFLSQIIGWVGTILVVLAYFLLIKSEKITEDSRLYQAMNLLGAICLGVNVYYQRAWPAFGLQIVWGIIAIFSLVKIKRKR